jgi:hypothetical protein
MNIRKIAFLLLLGLLFNKTAFSEGLSATQIVKWIDKSAGKVELSNITQIKLENGEDAYLASAEFPDQGRNFGAGYVLARPSLKKAMVVQDYGGQFNKVTIVRNYGTSVLIIGSAGSGQGSSEQSLYVVTFNGWKAKVMHTANMSNNFGNCGYEEDKPCKGNDVFLNPIEESRANTVSIVETVVDREGKDPDNLKSSVASKILSFSIEK